MAPPRYYWDPVIAPGGMTFYDGTYFPSGKPTCWSRPSTPAHWSASSLNGDKVVGEEWLLTDAGRIRDVEVAPDGAVLVITDEDDGALLRLTPEAPVD